MYSSTAAGPRRTWLVVETTVGTEPDHFGVEHVRQGGVVLSHDQVQEPVDERHRHDRGAASTSAFSARADAWRSRRNQRLQVRPQQHLSSAQLGVVAADQQTPTLTSLGEGVGATRPCRAAGPAQRRAVPSQPSRWIPFDDLEGTRAVPVCERVAHDGAEPGGPGGLLAHFLELREPLRQAFARRTGPTTPTDGGRSISTSTVSSILVLKRSPVLHPRSHDASRYRRCQRLQQTSNFVGKRGFWESLSLTPTWPNRDTALP